MRKKYAVMGGPEHRRGRLGLCYFTKYGDAKAWADKYGRKVRRLDPATDTYKLI